ncbi:MAG TPA: hypothetical protein VEO96_01355 [Thermoplasmata archaeon]|nr:hypothetical protein [Thermoplasmata archaeon]
MRDADAFDRTTFLGLSRDAKRDPYRLSLFAQHLASDERPLVLLAVQGGTLLITDLRVLELRAHLEVHGAWNVKEFQGYALQREIDRPSIRDVVHVVETDAASRGVRRVADRLHLETVEGPVDILVSLAPEPTLREAEFRDLRAAVLRGQP